MRNNFIKILANPDEKKDKLVYNDLLEAYTPIAGSRQVYHYQLGYTPSKLVNLKYEIQKKMEITDKHVALYNPADAVEDLKADLGVTDLTPEQIAEAQAEADAAEVARLKAEADQNPIITGMDEPVYQGLKLRDEYPFLNEENCPDVFKVLVSDKITAYKNYAAKHAEALEAADQTEAEDKLYTLAKEAITNFQNNIDIKDELDFYRESNGKVLGKHPKLKNLKIEQEIGEMSEADLVKARQNALKSVSKYGKGKKGENPDKETEWVFRAGLIDQNLKEKFNYNFDEK